MLEFSIFGILATCIAGMITAVSTKRDYLPVWERENGKEEIGNWLTGFLAKLKRTSTRTEKCRLISSVERMTFEDKRYAVWWNYVRFGEYEVEIIVYNYSTYNKDVLEKIKLTEFQKMILNSNSNLKNVMISRSEIKEENGDWEIEASLKKKLLSKGGEALVFSEKIGNSETAVRLQIFDSSLCTKNFGCDSITWKIHFENDFEAAVEMEKSRSENQIPKHKNVIKNFVNVELFHKDDLSYEDCLGWITIMEKAEEDLRSILKEEKIEIDERKKIAEEIKNGFVYLNKIGIGHYDRKMENILMLNGIPKIIDFGLVYEETGRKGYREMGYARRGSKFRHQGALLAATPGFANQAQFTFGRGYEVDNLWYFLICDWKSSWTLLFKPIGENERKTIDEIVKKCNASSIHKLKEGENSNISEITSIIKIPSSSSIFCLDDPNLTKSCHVSSLKQNATKYVNQDLQNLTKNVFDQKISNLCVPISVATLLRFSIKNDLDFEDKYGIYSAEKILSTLTLIVYPRSMAGLNLNPKKEETEFQTNEIEVLLERICKKTYLMPTGWQIIRQLDNRKDHQPKKSSCKFEGVDLNENFIFTRPLTVTGAYLFPEEVDNGITYPAEVLFHQMVLDRVDDPADEYVVQNTSFDIGGPVLRIPKTRAYYVTGDVMLKNSYGPGEYKFYGKKGEFMWLTNEHFGNTMQPKTWYLLPQAYSITLVPEPTVIQQNINPPQQPLALIHQPVDQHPQHHAHHQQPRQGHTGMHSGLQMNQYTNHAPPSGYQPAMPQPNSQIPYNVHIMQQMSQMQRLPYGQQQLMRPQMMQHAFPTNPLPQSEQLRQQAAMNFYPQQGPPGMNFVATQSGHQSTSTPFYIQQASGSFGSHLLGMANPGQMLNAFGINNYPSSLSPIAVHQVQSREIKKDGHSSERPLRESSETRGRKRRAKSPQMREETTEKNAAENHEI